MSRKTGFSKSIICGFSCVFLTAISLSAQANLVSNGSFETTSLATTGAFGSNVASWSNASGSSEALIFPGVGLQPLYSYSYAVYQPGLSATYTTYGLLGPFPTTSPDGGKYVLSDGDYLNQPISQTISGLTIGNFYQLSFYQALAQLDENLTPQGLVTGYWQVSLGAATQNSQLQKADGTTVVDSFGNLVQSATISPWTLQTMTFQASAATEVLSFLSVGTGLPPMIGLDGVSLEAVPLPAASWLLGSGLLGMITAGARRHRAKA
ncbi:MAG TPA: hypothetical protein VLC91_09780 [Spongiibacteraceae bacterium]|nr:hypothetical protein [Spongiibacteraceae bacterium]